MKRRDYPSSLPAIVVMGLLMLVSAPAARAEDDEDAADERAAIYDVRLRVFNATGEDLSGGMIADQVLPELEPYSASYTVSFPPGIYILQVGQKKQRVALRKQHDYTAVVLPERVRMFERPRWSNPKKALLVVHNLLGIAINLRTPQDVTVVEQVRPLESAHREVNALKTGFTVYGSDRRLTLARPVALERGRTFSLFVTGTATHPVATWIVN